MGPAPRTASAATPASWNARPTSSTASASHPGTPRTPRIALSAAAFEPRAASLTCEGGEFPYEPGPQTPCAEAGFAATARTFAGYGTISLTDPGSFFGWRVVIELLGDRARVCRSHFSDSAVACDQPDYQPQLLPSCATSGSVTLDRPVGSQAELAAARVRLDVTFGDDGARIHGTF